MKKQHNYTVMHWGTWQVESREGEIVAVKPVPGIKSLTHRPVASRRGDQPNAHSPSGGAPAISSTGRRHEKGEVKSPLSKSAGRWPWTCWRASCARSSALRQ